MIMIHDPQRNDETAPGQGERVAKALARAGVASRRDAEKLIEEGRVALNGEVLTSPAVNVRPDDILTVDGEVVDAAEPTRLFRYHKPVDLLTTHKDPQGRPTVFDALPPGLPRLISIGRLDINSEGLLLLTNDGELARALEQPSSGVVRRYRARARGRVTQVELDKLADGVSVAVTEGLEEGDVILQFVPGAPAGEGGGVVARAAQWRHAQTPVRNHEHPALSLRPGRRCGCGLLARRAAPGNPGTAGLDGGRLHLPGAGLVAGGDL